MAFLVTAQDIFMYYKVVHGMWDIRALRRLRSVGGIAPVNFCRRQRKQIGGIGAEQGGVAWSARFSIMAYLFHKLFNKELTL